jgi:NO-binding membrane sensor protein with MHYT domain
MPLIDHFSLGPLTPFLAYAMSCVGSMLGLLLTSRARVAEGQEARLSLIGGAVAIGGTGIWTMHFIAIMGFSVVGTVIRYNLPLTAASAVLAIVVVYAGLFIVTKGRGRTPYLLAGGVLTGVGVVGMHYLGMYAMNMSVEVSYDPVFVALSVVIAIAAAIAALWFALRVGGLVKIIGAALLMGIAVSGMHYTGMYAVSVHSQMSMTPVTGASAIDLLLPLIVGVSVITLGLLLSVMLSPSEKERLREAEFLARLESRDQKASESNLFTTPRSAPFGDERR